MNEHDVAHIDEQRGWVVLQCACGHRAEATTLSQAREKHAGHHGVEMARAAKQEAHRAADAEGTEE